MSKIPVGVLNNSRAVGISKPRGIPTTPAFTIGTQRLPRAGRILQWLTADLRRVFSVECRVAVVANAVAAEEAGAAAPTSRRRRAARAAAAPPAAVLPVVL